MLHYTVVDVCSASIEYHSSRVNKKEESNVIKEVWTLASVS
jgi:hypothetical protein